LFTQIAVGAILYFAILLIVKDEFIKELIDKGVNIIKRRSNKSDERAS